MPRESWKRESESARTVIYKHTSGKELYFFSDNSAELFLEDNISVLFYLKEDGLDEESILDMADKMLQKLL